MQIEQLPAPENMDMLACIKVTLTKDHLACLFIYIIDGHAIVWFLKLTSNMYMNIVKQSISFLNECFIKITIGLFLCKNDSQNNTKNTIIQ